MYANTLTHIMDNLYMTDGKLIRENGVVSIIGEIDPVIKTVIALTFNPTKEEVKYVVRSKNGTIIDQSVITTEMLIKSTQTYFKEQRTLRIREYGVDKYNDKIEQYKKNYIAGSREFRDLIVQQLFGGVLEFYNNDYELTFKGNRVKIEVAGKKVIFKFEGRYGTVQVYNGNGVHYRTVEYQKLNETVLELLTKGKETHKTLLNKIKMGLKENNIQAVEVNSNTLELERAYLEADGNFLRVKWKNGGGVTLNTKVFNYKGCVNELISMVGIGNTHQRS